MQKEEQSTLINLEADILERGIVTALDSSQDLHDVFKFGTLDLDEKKVILYHYMHITRPVAMLCKAFGTLSIKFTFY